jgi:hypothetical protein
VTTYKQQTQINKQTNMHTYIDFTPSVDAACELVKYVVFGFDEISNTKKISLIECLFDLACVPLTGYSFIHVYFCFFLVCMFVCLFVFLFLIIYFCSSLNKNNRKTKLGTLLPSTQSTSTPTVPFSEDRTFILTHTELHDLLPMFQNFVDNQSPV